jgi:DNA topoisomerase-3
MEQNKVGTDASMPVHIQNISERGYVKVDGNRRLIPTKLGKALIESLSAVDPEIVQPSIRADIENFVDQVAKGNKRFDEVLSYAVELYKKKFLYIRQNYEKILNSFKKYFEIDLMEMNKVYMNIKSKNEALKILNMKQKR